MVRMNESENVQECYSAGAKFISEFNKFIEDNQYKSKVKTMIFCGDKKKALETLEKFEF
jgi:hypothetical protein